MYIKIRLLFFVKVCVSENELKERVAKSNWAKVMSVMQVPKVGEVRFGKVNVGENISVHEISEKNVSDLLIR